MKQAAMDFHKKKDLKAIAHEHGHHILFLPPYSPDFSRIEPDFATMALT